MVAHCLLDKFISTHRIELHAVNAYSAKIDMNSQNWDKYKFIFNEMIHIWMRMVYIIEYI